MKKTKKKVIVAMSGGVDSSVAAFLLKKEGYQVEGVFIITQNNTEKDGGIQNDTQDAEKVCQKLDIPFQIVDAKKRFKDYVIKYFLDEYRRGRTPNPCVFCNENIKFEILFKIMFERKADYVATGHYARVTEHETPNAKQGKYKLSEAKDKSKDQSYFLYRLSQKELEKVIFPLGGYEKKEIRKMAKELGLPVYDKEESQDICFLANKELNDFLKENIKMKKGKIIDGQGEIIGEHQGLPLYTLGQRKGINIGGTGPYWVSGKDNWKNILYVSNNSENISLFSKKIEIEKVNWIMEQPKIFLKALVRVRYHNPLVYAMIKPAGRKCLVEFEKPQRAVTPGQSAVFYGKKGEILGGGIIR